MIGKTHTRHPLTRAAGWSLGGKLSSVFLGLVVNIFVARLLPPAEMGQYFLLVTFVGFGTILATAGLPQVMVRLVADNFGRQRFPAVKKNILRVFFLSGGVAFSVFLLYVFVVGDRLMDQYMILGGFQLNLAIGLWVVVNAQLRLLAEAFRGLKDIRLASIFSGMNNGGVLGALFLLIILSGMFYQGSASLLAVTRSSMAAVFLPFIIAGTFLWSYLQKMPSVNGGDWLDGEDSGLSYQYLVHASLPLLLTMLINYFLAFGDLWILGTTGSNEDVAYYAASARLVMLAALPLMVINGFVSPMIAEAYAKKKLKTIEASVRGLATVGFFAALVCTLVLGVAGKQMLGLIFGDFYRQGLGVLLILALGQLGNVWAGSCAIALSMSGHVRLLFGNTLIFGIMMITGGLWFSGRFGPEGLALWVALTNILRNLAMVWFVKHNLGFWSCAYWNPFHVRRIVNRF
jgi:O-antigen/teichoic acid export membrane protein